VSVVLYVAERRKQNATPKKKVEKTSTSAGCALGYKGASFL